MYRISGLDRVLEPKGQVPAMAWKLDNSRELRPGEVRVNIERLHLDWGNFQQIANSCGFDDLKIEAKIYDLIEKRGKLHNPFTGTGGVFQGHVDEISSEGTENCSLSEGDNLCCLLSLCEVPIYIEEITHIDYHYGQIACSGYAIMEYDAPVCLMPDDIHPGYVLVAMDEAGSLYSNYHIAQVHGNRKFIIIAKNAYEVLLYATAATEAAGPDCRIIAIMEKSFGDEVTEHKMEETLEPYVDRVFFMDVNEPLKTYGLLEDVFAKSGYADQVIVVDQVTGVETLAVMVAKPYGDLYFTTMENKYAKAKIVAKSMKKIVNTYAFEQYMEDDPDFAISLVRKIIPVLEKTDKLYIEKYKIKPAENSGPESILLKEAGAQDDFVFQDPLTKELVENTINIAKYDCNVIIQGETGVGKEKILSLIHQNSERHGNPCIRINCATIAESLAESEFFGYEPGSFTGAQSSGKKGYFELANNGILFLDEIGSLSMNMQGKLLRVLQENQFYRVGGTRQIAVNVRVVVANNVPLRELIDRGEFREDLYYRLNICQINVPPLRERREDILCLADSFIDHWNAKYKVEKSLSPGALNLLYNYNWPGNVRELENVIHRLVISCRGSVIDTEDVDQIISENIFDDKKLAMKMNLSMSDDLDFHRIMAEQEKQIIEYALNQEGTTRKAADLIGLPQTTFARKKLKYGL